MKSNNCSLPATPESPRSGCVQRNELVMAEGNSNGPTALDSTRIAQELASSSTKRRIAELGVLEHRLSSEGTASSPHPALPPI